MGVDDKRSASPFQPANFLHAGLDSEIVRWPNRSSEAYMEAEQYHSAWTSLRDVFQREFKDRHFASICKLAFKV